MACCALSPRTARKNLIFWHSGPQPHSKCGGSGELPVPSCRSPSVLLAGAASQRLWCGSDDCAKPSLLRLLSDF